MARRRLNSAWAVHKSWEIRVPTTWIQYCAKIVSQTWQRPNFLRAFDTKQTLRIYSQHRQNYRNNYYRAKVGKKLPKQFPEPFPVGKQNVGNSHFHTLQRHEKPEKNQKYIQGGSKSVTYYLIEQLKNHVRSWAMGEIGPMLAASRMHAYWQPIFQMHLQQYHLLSPQTLHKTWMVSRKFVETTVSFEMGTCIRFGGSCERFALALTDYQSYNVLCWQSSQLYLGKLSLRIVHSVFTQGNPLRRNANAKSQLFRRAIADVKIWEIDYAKAEKLRRQFRAVACLFGPFLQPNQ